MIKWKFYIILVFFFILETDMAHAAGLIMRIQQIKSMRQHQGMTPEQYQAYQAQQQGMAPGQQAAPATPTYQQTVDQRNQAIAQAILNAHNQAVTETVPFGNNPDLPPSQQQTSYTPATAPLPVAVPTNSTTVKDVVDLSEVWKKLDTKSTVWTLLMDDQAKVLTVSEFIDRFRQQGVKINGQPEHYVQMIDQIVTQSPQMLDRPFGELIQIVAIIEYDFDNGMDKDILAKKVLGEEGFEANKKRFGH